MPQSKITSWLRSLLRSSPRRSIAVLVGAGFVAGIVAVASFEVTMSATSSEAFCTSCHEMQLPFEQLQQTPHFSNASGVVATCSDCHVPQEFLPKMVRKVEAAREVWGNITGVINTPEKYAAHAPAMKERELARLRANDSQECRNCHNEERMVEEEQSKMARRFHQPGRVKDKTCIDCHDGIAHPQG